MRFLSTNERQLPTTYRNRSGLAASPANSFLDISELPTDASEIDSSLEWTSSIDLKKLDDINWHDPNLAPTAGPESSNLESPLNEERAFFKQEDRHTSPTESTSFRRHGDLLAAQEAASAITNNPLLVNPKMEDAFHNVGLDKIHYDNNQNPGQISLLRSQGQFS